MGPQKSSKNSVVHISISETFWLIEEGTSIPKEEVTCPQPHSEEEAKFPGLKISFNHLNQSYWADHTASNLQTTWQGSCSPSAHPYARNGAPLSLIIFKWLSQLHWYFGQKRKSLWPQQVVTAWGRADEFPYRPRKVTGHLACSADPEGEDFFPNHDGQWQQMVGRCHSSFSAVITTKGHFSSKVQSGRCLMSGTDPQMPRQWCRPHRWKLKYLFIGMIQKFPVLITYSARGKVPSDSVIDTRSPSSH